MPRGLLAIAVLAAAAFGQPVETRYAPAPGAYFRLTVEKTGLWSGRKHVFEFQRYTARALGKESVELEVDAASATCNDTWVSEKDRAKVLEYMWKDMLDVEHHPKLVFRSEKVVDQGGGRFEVVGELTVRGVAKPVTVAVTMRDGVVTGQATVRIKDYGLTPPKAALGAIGTKNEMTVSFRLVAAP